MKPPMIAYSAIVTRSSSEYGMRLRFKYMSANAASMPSIIIRPKVGISSEPI